MVLFRSERKLRRITRRARRDHVLLQLHKAGPSVVYAALLHCAQARNYNPGWAKHGFREIFGQEPRPQDRRAEPNATPGVVNDLVIEWAAARKRKARPRLPLFKGDRNGSP
jgi:hypothetical protein